MASRRSGPGIHVAVPAGLVADLAQIDLQHLNAGRLQRRQAMFVQQPAELGKPAARIQDLALPRRVAQRVSLACEGQVRSSVGLRSEGQSHASQGSAPRVR